MLEPVVLHQLSQHFSVPRGHVEFVKLVRGGLVPEPLVGLGLPVDGPIEDLPEGAVGVEQERLR